MLEYSFVPGTMEPFNTGPVNTDVVPEDISSAFQHYQILWPLADLPV
jgi:hypothetical protein